MAGARPIRVTITGDASGLQRALKTSETSLAAIDGRMARAGKALDTAFKAGAAVAGLDLVAQGVMSVVNAASRLEQSQGAVQAVFKDQAGSMTAAAEAADTMGLSQSAYGEMAAKLGSQLKNLGTDVDQVAPKTQALIDLGADLAAQFGGSTQEAVDALSATFRGEYDPIERYGITLKASSVQAAAAAGGISTAQATINTIMGQSKDAIGAVEREYDTFAAAQGRFSASFDDAQSNIGRGFLPVMTGAADAASKFGNFIAAIPDGLMELAGTAIAATAGIKGLQIALGLGAGKAQQLAANWRAVEYLNLSGPAAGMERTSTALSKVGTALPIVGAGLIAFGEAMSFINDKAKEGAISAADFQRALSSGGLNTNQIDQVSESMGALTDDFNQVQQILGTMGGGLLGRAFASQDLTRAQEDVDRLNQSLMEFMKIDPAAGAAATKQAFDDLVAAGVPAEVAAKQLAGSLAQADAIINQVGTSAVDTAGQVGLLEASFDEASAAASDFANYLDGVFSDLDVAVAVQEWRTALSGIKDATRDGLDATEIRNYNQAWRGVTDSMIAAGAGPDAVIAKYDQMREGLRRALQEAGVSGPRINQILRQAFGDRYEIVIGIKDKAVGEKARSLKQLLDSTLKPKDILVSADPSRARKGAKDAQSAVDGVKQKRPAAIDGNPDPAKSAAKGAQSSIDGVDQRRTPNIDANEDPAVSAAQSAQSAISGIIGTTVDIIANVIVSGPAKALELLGVFGRAFGGLEDGGLTRDGAIAAWSRAGGGGFLSQLMSGKTPKTKYTLALEVQIGGTFKNVANQLQAWTKAAKEAEKAIEKTQRVLSDPDTSKADKKQARARIDRLRDAKAYANDQIQAINAWVARNDRAAQEYLRIYRDMYSQAEQALARTRDNQLAAAAQLENAADNAKQRWESAAASIANSANGLNIIKAGTDADNAADKIADLQAQLAIAWNPTQIAELNRQIAELQSQDTIGEQITAQVAQTTQFVTLMDQLKKTMSPQALQQIIDAGPEQGLAIAQALANDPALAASYNAAYSQMGNLTNAFGQNMATSLGAGIVEGTTMAWNDPRVAATVARMRSEAEATYQAGLAGLPAAIQKKALKGLDDSKAEMINIFSDAVRKGIIKGLGGSPGRRGNANSRFLDDSIAGWATTTRSTVPATVTVTKNVNVRLDANLVDPAGAAQAIEGLLEDRADLWAVRL